MSGAMLAGCGVQESFKEASVEVDRFHAALDAGQWQRLWAQADPELRKATGAEQFGQLLEAVHRKLGKVKSSEQTGWNANATTGGTFLTLTMQTRFEKGSGAEQFVYRKGEGNKLTLVGYNIESREMMLN
ncbi:DUF4019 domain-containing protein [Novosphingobium sp. CF614]|uniref:DUF4019 domain-containing protein n=1 Tax=Novosphingobium sp. CF614 TaxID=1884364 RepID=UPI00210126F5|nr:DUF4019 domain-containing protein [Novosphingobium sp. CF614]